MWEPSVTASLESNARKKNSVTASREQKRAVFIIVVGSHRQRTDRFSTGAAQFLTLIIVQKQDQMSFQLIVFCCTT